ncbi:MAG: hypothetical protein ACRD5M_13000 [Candidatus Acidiferrales bacterium]
MNVRTKIPVLMILMVVASVAARSAAAQTDSPPHQDAPPVQTDNSSLPDAPKARANPAPPRTRPQDAPKAKTITIPAGTSLLIRMISNVDSRKNHVGEYFHASLESALMVDDTVIAPKGADVYGKLTNAKDAGKISGGAELTLELTGVRIGENLVQIQSTSYDVVGKGRGGQSAKRIGGGAVLGAIIGGIAGGGTGAAIGAGVGAGAGTAVQLSTHGERIRIPSETLLEFTTEQPVEVPAPNDSQ